MKVCTWITQKFLTLVNQIQNILKHQKCIFYSDFLSFRPEILINYHSPKGVELFDFCFDIINDFLLLQNFIMMIVEAWLNTFSSQDHKIIYLWRRPQSKIAKNYFIKPFSGIFCSSHLHLKIVNDKETIWINFNMYHVCPLYQNLKRGQGVNSPQNKQILC